MHELEPWDWIWMGPSLLIILPTVVVFAIITAPIWLTWRIIYNWDQRTSKLTIKMLRNENKELWDRVKEAESAD